MITMNIKKTIIYLLILLLPITSYTAKAQAQTINREDVVWCAGYWAAPTHWNPAFWGGEAWGGFFMYVPMFEWNYQTDSLIPMLGETMAWNEDGSELHITIHDEAIWSDGVSITSQDVNWTFNYFYDMGQWGGGFSKRVNNFVIVDDKEFYLEMKPEYYYSRHIWNYFVGYYKVLPQHTWDAISIFYSGAPLNASNLWTLAYWDQFTNNWLDPAFPAAWKVGSGPYVPYFVSETKDKQIYKKVDTWWGDGVITDGFAGMPTYIGQLHYTTNFAMNEAFADNQIDWYGGYYPRIWELLAVNPNIHTWVEEDPYFLPISGMIEIVPNHRRHPFDQPWLRRALAYGINYDDLSEVSASGYLEKARVGFVDDRSLTQDDYYDPTIEATYAVDFNLTKAREILAEHCLEIGGKWYTKNSTAWFNTTGAGGDPIVDDYTGTLVDDPLTPDNETELADETNVLLDDWDIIVPYGWSDSMMQTTLLATYWADLGITTNPTFVEYGQYLDLGVQNEASNFDLMHFCMGFAPANEIYEGFDKLVGTANNWENWTAWESPEFGALLADLEVAVKGTTEEWNIVHDMQELLAIEMPSIPIAPNGYWYGFNDKYWSGWANELNPYIQPVAPWEAGHTGAMLFVLMNLSPTGVVGVPPIPGFGLGVLFFSGLAAVVFSIIRVKKRK